MDTMIDIRKPGEYDTAVELLKDLEAVAQCTDHAEGFNRRVALLHERHHRKASLIARFDRAGLTITSARP